MKLIKYLYAFMASVILFTSCDLNKMHVFNDKDAFVAFRSSTISIGEDKGEIDIPVLLTSLSGMGTTVNFEIVTDSITTAVEGVNFTILNS